MSQLRPLVLEERYGNGYAMQLSTHACRMLTLFRTSLLIERFTDLKRPLVGVRTCDTYHVRWTTDLSLLNRVE